VTAVTTLDFTLGSFIVVLFLIVAAVYLARKDRVTRVKLGIFFEREREREVGVPEQETKIMGPWPGQKKEDE
jgi:hypothetical protein